MTKERITDIVAAGGLTSPAWLPTLKEVSAIAADLLPIVGLIWLLFRFYRWLRSPKVSED